jgi:flavin-binding protein dodecin
MNRCLAGDDIMVYKYIDIVGTSNTDMSAAVDNAIEEASKTVKNIKWGELGRVTFRVEEGKKIEYQAEVRIGFEVIRGNNNED